MQLRRLTMREQLDELPMLSVVRDSNGNVFQYWPGIITGNGMQWAQLGLTRLNLTPGADVEYATPTLPCQLLFDADNDTTEDAV